MTKPHETVSFYPDEQSEDIRRAYKAYYYADYEVRFAKGVALFIRQSRHEGLTDDDTEVFRNLLISFRTELSALVRSCSGLGTGRLFVREPGTYTSSDTSGRAIEEDQRNLRLKLSLPNGIVHSIEIPMNAQANERIESLHNAIAKALRTWSTVEENKKDRGGIEQD